MYEGTTTAVTVPAYNEAAHVGDVIDSVPDFVDRVYVVDDGSTDGTWAEIQEAAAARNDRDSPEPERFDRTVVPLRHEENRGVGGAIKTGYQQAIADDVGATAVMAGDGQMNPETLERYFDPVVTGRAEYAKGNRFLRREDRSEMPEFRIFGTVILTTLTRIASGYWRTGDPQNGYTVISLGALERLDVDALYEGYGFLNDLLIRLNAADCRVAEVRRRSSFSYDEDWSSDIEYREFVPGLSKLLLSGFLWRLREKHLNRGFHPLTGGYLLGAGGLAAGLGGTLTELARRETDGVADWLLVLLAGGGLFLLGAALDMAENEPLAAEEDDRGRPTGGTDDTDTAEAAPDAGDEQPTAPTN